MQLKVEYVESRPGYVPFSNQVLKDVRLGFLANAAGNRGSQAYIVFERIKEGKVDILI